MKFSRLVRRISNKVAHILLRLDGIQAEPDCMISMFSKVRQIGGGEIKIGKRCQIHHGAMILSYGGNIEIGNDVSINPYTILYGHGGLKIGDGVRIAAHCVIIPSNHKFQEKSRPIFEQGETSVGIEIESDVWIGAGVKILDGLTISKGCVIAAGAVLTKSTEPFGIYAGVPAKKVAERS